MTDIPEQFHIKSDPSANSAAVIHYPNVRFTLLTSRLVRLEYSPDDVFEDRASQVFWNRQQPAPEYELIRLEDRLEIVTQHLHIHYHLGQPFFPSSLSIRVKDTNTVWQYGDPDRANLQGTSRTLDQTRGPVPLEPGLISRSGWAVVDDSRSLVFNAQGWLEPRKDPLETKDLYFFGYGWDYQDCLNDFSAIAGRVPLIPRWALGNWWSRYWEYTQEELTQLLLNFEEHAVPLSVCIIDMDWHITKTGNTSSGWTGYTWNPDLFPDPDRFIAFLHRKGLRTALNLHPAEGIHPHEEMYPEMAKRMGTDPATKIPVAFDLAVPEFASAYFEILHHPKEAQGIDFWWLDWQQGTLSKLPGLDPLWWLNHLHALDLGRDGSKRPFVFSRWGGLGNHRYPIGFSGDTHVSWETLAFQPYFTATAANVGYGWWSHDIGGHMDGIEDAELYTRWVQFGVFSPVMRLHSTKNPFHERQPWKYDAETFRVTRYAMQLRHALIPYLYSMAWRNHHQNVTLVRPMYYEYSRQEEAYHCPNQYIFGSELVAAPFTSPRHPDTRLARQAVWMPEGDWFDFFTGQRYPGDGWQAIYGGLEDIPVFARAGAIVPLAPLRGWGGVDNPTHLSIHIFPGADNRFELFEDGGETTAHQQGEYAITPFVQRWTNEKLIFQIGPTEGDLRQVPNQRVYDLIFHTLVEPEQVEILLNGKPQKTEFTYETSKRSVHIRNLTLLPSSQVIISVHAKNHPLMVDQDHTLDNCRKLLGAFRMDTIAKATLDSLLPHIIADPDLLSTYQSAMTDEHLRALFEVITQAGVEHITQSGEGTYILWNNCSDPGTNYLLSVDQTIDSRTIERYYGENGILPKFKGIKPASEFHSNPWKLRVNYHNILSLNFSGNLRI